MDIKRLVTDIHRATGIQLDESDPVLAAAVINERLLDAALVDLRRAIRTAGDQWAAQYVQNEDAAKQAASAVITGAAAWLDERFRDAGEAVAAKVIADIRDEMKPVQAAAANAKRFALLSGVASFIAVGVAAGLAAGFL